MDSIVVRSGSTYGESAASASTNSRGTQPRLDDYLLLWFNMDEHMDPASTSRGVLAARLAAKSCREVGLDKRHVGAVFVTFSTY
jgi:hypothetical protein